MTCFWLHHWMNTHLAKAFTHTPLNRQDPGSWAQCWRSSHQRNCAGKQKWVAARHCASSTSPQFRRKRRSSQQRPLWVWACGSPCPLWTAPQRPTYLWKTEHNKETTEKKGKKGTGNPPFSQIVLVCCDALPHQAGYKWLNSSQDTCHPGQNQDRWTQQLILMYLTGYPTPLPHPTPQFPYSWLMSVCVYLMCAWVWVCICGGRRGLCTGVSYVCECIST